MLTPYKDNGHLTNAEKHFNKTLSRERVCIEHAFGVLKQRFRQLFYTKLRGIKCLCHFIRACVVLHNLADEEDFDFDYADPDDPASLDVHNEPKVTVDEITNGNILRTEITQNLYALVTVTT